MGTNNLTFYSHSLASMRWIKSLCLFASFMFLGCASAEKKEAMMKEVVMEKTTFSFDQDEHPFDLFPKYRVVPGDVLDVLFQIRTWIEKEHFRLAVDHTVAVKFIHAPELNETQMIRPDGRISLPYLGEVHVVGKTVDELTNELQGYYKTVLQDPSLYIVVPEFRSSIKELKADLHTAPRGLSRLVTVRPDGYVTFPMVGELFVADKTIFEVNNTLNEMYDEIIPGLHVDLFLEKHAGSMVYVMGEVRKPGPYQIIKPITVVEAITMAESHLPGAKLDSVIVIRKHERKMIAKRVNLNNVLDLNKGSEFFYLKPDDIVYVPKTWISKTAEIMRDLRDLIFFRGWMIGFSWQLHDED